MAPGPPTVPRPRPPWRRILAWLCVLALAGLVALELVLRLVVGLGDPPLYVTDPKIEYLMAPGVYHRFGHTITVNQWHMRSPGFAERRASPGEIRVLVIGDSVPNGGAPTDDKDLATTLLGPQLARLYAKPCSVANISAGSWGPDNELAYLQKFGTFDADVAVIVLNSFDWGDVPTFAPLTAEQPTSKPILAIQEALINYLPRLLGRSSAPTTYDEANPPVAMTDQSMKALRDLVALLRAANVRVAIVQHAKQSEIERGYTAGHDKILALATELQVPVIQTRDLFAAALKKSPNPYRDDIHPNAAGQKVLLEALEEAVKAALPPSERSGPGN